MAASIGKVFEREMAKVVRLLIETRAVGLVRFPDSGDAGSLIAAQPSDYLLGLPPGCVNLHDGQRMMFLEAKASEEHHKLGKAMVRPAQRGAIAKFRYLLNIPYYIVFWDAQDGVIQLWDGLAIHGERNIRKEFMLAEWKGCGSYTRLNTKAVADHIADYFQIPITKDTLSKAR